MGFQFLKQMGLFSHEKTPVFNDAVKMCRAMLDCEVSLLTLIDEERDRQFFKAEIGLPQPWSELRETPLSHSFCKTVVAFGKPLIIADSRIDERVKGNPVIEELGVIAYLGVPIKNRSGESIAALCAIDTKCRKWTSSDLDIITAIGVGVSHQIKLMSLLQGSKALRNKEEEWLPGQHEVARGRSSKAILTYVSSADGCEFIENISDTCKEIWEIDSQELRQNYHNFWAMGDPMDIMEARASLGRSAASLNSWKHQWEIVTPSGKRKVLHGYGQPEILPDGGIRWSAIIIDAGTGLL